MNKLNRLLEKLIAFEARSAGSAPGWLWAEIGRELGPLSNPGRTRGEARPLDSSN